MSIVVSKGRVKGLWEEKRFCEKQFRKWISKYIAEDRVVIQEIKELSAKAASTQCSSKLGIMSDILETTVSGKLQHSCVTIGAQLFGIRLALEKGPSNWLNKRRTSKVPLMDTDCSALNSILSRGFC
ncbi:hypothetical protein N7456_007167 [Penicillium angulare]|uniref:Uncharacterized protein n=1 Tax=Penicillium angulare TaxID=116970 RepID=A0A9W9KCA8_9EURO|nr:hypothetical protein N7456_007167 [Penicillium angulare]